MSRETPLYLRKILPTKNSDNPAYSGRNPFGFIHFNYRTERFKSSFFPSSVRVWNSLQPNWHQAEHLLAFKKIINVNYIPPSPPSYYGQGQRNLAVYHTRLRLGHSALNNHLFKIGASNSPQCTCGFKEESEIHFLLSCPLYLQARLHLFQQLRTIIGPSFETVYRGTQAKLNLILFGSAELDTHTNNLVLAEVLRYIQLTGRFKI